MENIELKSCPFCGGNGKIKAKVKRSTGFTIWCECEKCNAKTVGYCPNITSEDNSMESIEVCRGYAIEKWNHRADEEKQ